MTDFDTYGDKKVNTDENEVCTAASSENTKDGCLQQESGCDECHEDEKAADSRPYSEVYKNTSRSDSGVNDGYGRRPYTQGARPADTRPYAQGARPAGARPYVQGARPAGARPYVQGARPADTRPYVQGARPAGTRPYVQGARPAGTRPYAQGARPAGTRPYAQSVSPADTRPYTQRQVCGGAERSMAETHYQPSVNTGVYNGAYTEQNGVYASSQSAPSAWQKFKNFCFGEDVKPLLLMTGAFGCALIMNLILTGMLSSFILASETTMSLYFDNYLIFITVSIGMSVVALAGPFLLAYAVLRKLNVYSSPLPFDRPGKKRHNLLLVLSGVGFCYLGNIITGLITNFFGLFGIEFFSGSQEIVSGSFEASGTFEYIVTVFAMSVVPALFEELVFRGIIMQPLRRYGDGFAVFVSAFIFAVVHQNMTQTPFAFIAGLALGYVAVVSGSLWTSVILHFINNFLATVVSLFIPYLSDEGYMIFSSVYVYGIIFVGFIAFIAYALHNRAWFRLRKGDKGHVGFFRKNIVAFLNPPFCVANTILVFTVLSDIVLPFIYEAMGLM